MSATVDALNAIRDEFGTLTPELVADVAAAADHPLHAQVYDCAPEEASRRYYIERARKLLQVTFKPTPNAPADLRAFVAVRGADAPRSEYVPTDEAMADPFTRKLVLNQMKREAAAFAARYRHMSEFAATVAAMLEGRAS